ncbi:Origin recognition complex subunit 2 [Trinorchestia longiramus]|nr:Origin recognition complex subunit 2 [Trinorchestia longiramus]
MSQFAHSAVCVWAGAKRLVAESKPRLLCKKQRRCAPEETASGDSYFLHNDGGATGGRTSDHTLSQLTVPRLSLEALKQVVGPDGLDLHHLQHRKTLLQQHCALFDKWTTLMEHGFSVCVHGVGSKKPLLASYQELHLENVDHVVVNGFFPSLTLKSIVSCIVEEVLCLDNKPPSLADQLELLHTLYRRPSVAPLTLVVHNLDGPMLRSNAVQRPLSRLCALPSVRLLASVDHINAPLTLFSYLDLDLDLRANVWLGPL